MNTLVRVALRRLPRMIDPLTGLFIFRGEGFDLVPSGSSVRYTAMTLLGLERAEAHHGHSVTIDRGKIFNALDRALPALDNSGDLALVLWASARSARPLAERALRELIAFGELTRLRRGDAFHSTELAWVVTAFAEALTVGLGNERRVREKLDEAYARLRANQGTSGLFAFARPRAGAGGLLGRVRSELGFFDAQVYGIVAALARHRAVSDLEALDVARGVGHTLLRHQRAMGQWPWHYNVRSGEVVDVYPVYAVHQDGMAPMALLPLERVGRVPTREAVFRGVEWLFGDNELGAKLIDAEADRIWRSIRRRPPLGRLVLPLKAASLVGAPPSLDLGGRLAAPSWLGIDRELRPYHLGWCLYAFAEMSGDGARSA